MPAVPRSLTAQKAAVLSGKMHFRVSFVAHDGGRICEIIKQRTNARSNACADYDASLEPRFFSLRLEDAQVL